MINILISDPLAQEGIDLLKSMQDVEVTVKTGLTEDELCGIIGEYDGLIIRSGTQVTKRVLEHRGRLKAVARAGVGVDNIDVYEATKQGVIVMNTPGGNTLSAAEHTMALMLALSRNIVPACESMKAGKWERKTFIGNQLKGKVLGIIGLGRIGMSVASMAAGFGMQLLGYDPFFASADTEGLDMDITDDLEKLFRRSDYITVHVPKNDQTVNLIDKEAIKLMKPAVRLINTARGGIINEDDAYDALKEGKIAGAAFDVFPKEPPENRRFTEDSRILVTPHLGASTEEAQVEVALEAAQILVNALTGGPVKNAVNAPSLSSTLSPMAASYCELAKRIGMLLSSIAPGTVKKVQVEYRGKIAERNVEPVTLSFTMGLIQKYFDLPLNVINAGIMAKERGVSIDQVKNSDPKDVSSSFTARVETDAVTRQVTGSVFGGSQLRILEIDGFTAETAPYGTLLVIFNVDKPGVIGAVGTVCAAYDLNIGTMGVGRSRELERAVLALSLDKEPDSRCMEEFRRLDFVNEIYVCRLD